MAFFVLDLADIDASGKDYSFAVGAPFLDAALAGTSVVKDPARLPGSLDVHAQRTGKDVLVQGRLETGVLAECARCLEPAHVSVAVDLAVVFSPSATPAATRGRHAAAPVVIDDDDEDDGVERERFTGEQIHLDGLVREQILVEVPMSPLCREDCPGIPVPVRVVAPADFRAVDPRLAPLAALAGQMKKKE